MPWEPALMIFFFSLFYHLFFNLAPYLSCHCPAQDSPSGMTKGCLKEASSVNFCWIFLSFPFDDVTFLLLFVILPRSVTQGNTLFCLELTIGKYSWLPKTGFPSNLITLAIWNWNYHYHKSLSRQYRTRLEHKTTSFIRNLYHWKMLTKISSWVYQKRDLKETIWLVFLSENVVRGQLRQFRLYIKI